ncbi:MotE family protein [Thiohalorhabdus methylotrophus]|uniref:MotE family protein n=1 Tax=Thiohalorhabdus methylotrophus TaxID=3242694 RepID=A0ABV4TW02_9GAMM
MTGAMSAAGGWLRRAVLGVLGLLVLLRFVGSEGPTQGERAGDSLRVPRDAVTTARAEEQADGMQGEKPAVDLRPEEVRVLKELKARRESVRQDREKLEKTRERLDILEKKVSKDLGRLKRYRDQIQAGLDREEEIRSDKMRHLISVYSNMNPQKAAERINSMDKSTAVKLLSGMSGQAAGRILSFVEPEKANRISQSMTKLVNDVED